MPPTDPSPWQPPALRTPPPPPPTRPAAPPPPPGSPPGFGAPPGYPAGYGAPLPMFVAIKPPRPRTRAAALLMLVGGLVMIIGAVLPWISDGGTNYNAFDEWRIGLFLEDTPPGGMFVLLGVVLIGFGIATLAAGRVLPIMIIGIVVAAVAVLGTITHLADYADVTDATTASLGAGIIVTMIGSAAALAGAIAGCATRRRWRPGAELH